MQTVLGVLAALGGAAAGLFTQMSAGLRLLLLLMALDYGSALVLAALGKSPKSATGALNSKAGFVGLAKKALIMLIVLLATVLDKALGTDRMVFQTAAACYYIANEGISIIENAGKIGVPVPSALKKALEQLRDKNDGGGDDPDKDK